MYEQGDTVPLAFRLTDGANGAVNAASGTVTVTLPDGTAGSPQTLTTPERAGDYRYAYASTAAGRHTVRWVFTDPDRVATDVFNVAERNDALIGLAEAKKTLGIPLADTSKDDQLRGLVASLTPVVEHYIGAVVRREWTERRSGGRPVLPLDHTPVLSITSVTESGAVVPPEGYSCANGVLTRLFGGVEFCWRPGVDNIVINLVAGRLETPPNAIEAVQQLLRVNARPVLGGNYSAYDQNPDAGERTLGFWVPRGVLALLQAEPAPVGMA